MPTRSTTQKSQFTFVPFPAKASPAPHFANFGVALDKNRKARRFRTLERMIREVIEERPELQPPKAHIRIDSPLAPVLGHEASLTQCLTNLMGNAVKFVARDTVPDHQRFPEPARANAAAPLVCGG